MDENRTHRAGWRRRGVPRWAPLGLGLGIGLLGGVGYGLTAAPQYTATSYVMVVPQHGDSTTAIGFAQAYGRVVTGAAVLAGAQADTRMSVDDLRGSVQAATSPDAPMISVTGTGPRAARAAQVANSVARSLTRSANGNANATGVRLLVFSPAAAPTSPASPSVPLSAAVGTSAGGLLGALVLLVRPRGRRDEPEASVPGPAQDPAQAPAHVTAQTAPQAVPQAADPAHGQPAPAQPAARTAARESV